ncbi:hypothetical protein TRFO_10651 [Tritrichomonas foetus]|uniref:Uncharacterized protein n=1 Tax=Tritrichomonas foetus TaxID=1144522 RepID=A0A1J4JCM7_9EUKA|nr:hypothetical protein TRFO_10651 [Tritrichomonas foetus]|eukprot:OHS95165.1 hypothetical protein TRFO_10651 [Tritrichomonas foetus]
MENYESNLKISEKDYQAEIDAVDALKFETDQLQLELSKLESSFKTVMKQSSNATTKKQALEKERAEMEAKLNHEEEEEKIEFVEEEEEKNEEQQQQPATMPLWSPKSELKPPQKPFVESQYLENIEKADNFMKIAPTEALKQCFKLIDQRDLNHKAALVDFLYHCAVEMKQPEMCSSLAALLAAKDKTCDDFAVSLLLFAASKDIPDALFNLGVMTRLGRGVMQNDEAAAQMIIKAANMGFEQALQAAGAAC